jgi:hypothetical protein
VSNGSAFTTTRWDIWSPAVTWVDVQIGDLNGDGKADLIGRVMQDGTWWGGLSNGTSLKTSLFDMWNPNVTWDDVHIGDLNGDGKADIVGRVGETGQWFAGLSTGTSLTTSLWGAWAPDSRNVTWVDVQIGDLNGDGKADIVGRLAQTGQWFANITGSTGTVFLAPQLWDVWSTAVTWDDVRIGDFNGDHKMDLAGRVDSTGQWFVSLSNGSAFTTSQWGVWDPNTRWQAVRTGAFV